MLTLSDINNIETEEDVSDVEYYQSIQRAINAKSWAFQGSYGRAMMDAIKSGYCMLGTEATKDYYGNRIPSRYEVKAGSQGSPEYVADRQGDLWLEVISEA